MDIPIIFIHYSDSSYLKYILQSASYFNPEKNIILLGDQTNRQYIKSGIEHYMVDDYYYGDLVENFEKSYQLICGEKFNYNKNLGVEYWAKFTFKRWFAIHNFITKNNIKRFWTFDSDTLIITSLSKYEKPLEAYDCTEQCCGTCMNGLINSKDVVKGYLIKINDLFNRTEYLKKQKKDFETEKSFGFTEMRAYTTYKSEEKIRSIHLEKAVNNEYFDDCFCMPFEMELLPVKYNNHPLKKAYIFRDGNLYYQHKISKKYLKVNTINLSWMPDYIFKKIYTAAKNNYAYKKNLPVNTLTTKVLSLNAPFMEVIKNNIKKLLNRN